MVSFELALRVGADSFCGEAFGAVWVKVNVSVEIGEGGLIIFLAEMDEGKKAVNFGLLRCQGLSGFRRFQRGFDMHAIEFEFSQFVVTDPRVRIQFEAAAE